MNFLKFDLLFLFLMFILDFFYSWQNMDINLSNVTYTNFDGARDMSYVIPNFPLYLDINWTKLLCQK